MGECFSVWVFVCSFSAIDSCVARRMSVAESGTQSKTLGLATMAILHQGTLTGVSWAKCFMDGVLILMYKDYQDTSRPPFATRC